MTGARLQTPPPVERRRAGETEPIYRFEYDVIGGYILFYVQGFWNEDETSSYLREGETFVAECRRRFGEVNILVDRRRAQVQSAPIADRLARGTAAIEPGDRIAIVVGSNLAKMQLDRSVDHPTAKSFLSIDDARDWLTAGR